MNVSQTKTFRETWISEIPKVLLFTISRVNYDINQQKLVKNYKRFEFEKTIYVDRFLIENKNKDEELNQKVIGLRDKQK